MNQQFQKEDNISSRLRGCIHTIPKGTEERMQLKQAFGSERCVLWKKGKWKGGISRGSESGKGRHAMEKNLKWYELQGGVAKRGSSRSPLEFTGE